MFILCDLVCEKIFSTEKVKEKNSVLTESLLGDTGRIETATKIGVLLLTYMSLSFSKRIFKIRGYGPSGPAAL